MLTLRLPDSPWIERTRCFSAKGRVFQLDQYLNRRQEDFPQADLKQLWDYIEERGEAIERDNAGTLIPETLAWVPDELRGQWRRQWLNAHEKGTRQLFPALVDVHNPGLTGGVQNQPDFHVGSVDHQTRFPSGVPRFVKEKMAEYGAMNGRVYAPVRTFLSDDAEAVILGLGSVTDDAKAVATYPRGQGKKVGMVSASAIIGRETLRSTTSGPSSSWPAPFPARGSSTVLSSVICLRSNRSKRFSHLPPAPHLLETSRPGAIAIGDVRAGSIKRVASAIGEKSIAVAFTQPGTSRRKETT